MGIVWRNNPLLLNSSNLAQQPGGTPLAFLP